MLQGKPEAMMQLAAEPAGRCDDCHLPESVAELPFQLDHIIALKHLGLTDESKLTLACYHCNSAKGPNIAGVDPVSGCITSLFHPRQDRMGGALQVAQWMAIWQDAESSCNDPGARHQ